MTCKNGHELTAATMRFTPEGWRRCIVCHREGMRRRRRADPAFRARQHDAHNRAAAARRLRAQVAPLPSKSNEEWRSIPGYEGIYQASTRGRIRRVHQHKGATRGRILQPHLKFAGYYQVQLTRSQQDRRWVTVHSIVALTFIGARPVGKEINHRNMRRLDNRVANLEYVTRSENLLHRIAFKKTKQPRPRQLRLSA